MGLTEQHNMNTPSGESEGSRNVNANVQQSPVLEAISAHLEKWYPQKIDRQDVIDQISELEGIVEQPPVGLNLPYAGESA